jgi:hypothetical protein
MKMIRLILRKLLQAFAFLFLTALTQLGGIAYLVSLYLKRRKGFTKGKTALAFIGVYLILSIIVAPLFAPLFGRKALPCFGDVRPLNVMTCVLNRHYVNPQLYDQLLRAEAHMQKTFPESKLQYLDACFPFLNGFPLLPHLSHNDGRKIDLAYYYMDTQTNKPGSYAPSIIGYGVYETPREDEPNTPEKCEETGSWWYSAVGWIVPQWNKEKYKVNKVQTRMLIQFLAEDDLTEKLFIEPHLKYRWNLARFEKVRFHGCHAVRHDDHIHTQVSLNGHLQ